MKFGYFDDINKEYVIDTPKTPMPWINYLGTNSMFGIISNTAGGYSFYKDAKMRRISRYRYNNIPTDLGGRYFYIKDGRVFNFYFTTAEVSLKVSVVFISIPKAEFKKREKF